jgi:hypothetical protein
MHPREQRGLFLLSATYLADTQAVASNRHTGTLVVSVSSPQAATQLNNYFQMTVRRAIATLEPKISGVQVHSVTAVPGPPHSRERDDEGTTPPTQPG